MIRAGTCYSCGAAIRWVKLAPTFKPHPVDPEPNPAGNIHADDVGRATILPRDNLAKARAAGVELLISHFATCPHAVNRRPNTPIPEPATPVRSLVRTAPAGGAEPSPIPRPRGRERGLTEGEITYLEALRASEAEPAPAPRPATPPPPPAPAVTPEPEPTNRAERRAREFRCSRCEALQARLAALAKAAGYEGTPAADRLPEHVAKLRASSITPAELERLRQLEQKERELREVLATARAELARANAEHAKACDEAEQIGGPWLAELRALRAQFAGATSGEARGARAALRELASRLGYRLRA